MKSSFATLTAAAHDTRRQRRRRTDDSAWNLLLLWLRITKTIIGRSTGMASTLCLKDFKSDWWDQTTGGWRACHIFHVLPNFSFVQNQESEVSVAVYSFFLVWLQLMPLFRMNSIRSRTSLKGRFRFRRLRIVLRAQGTIVWTYSSSWSFDSITYVRRTSFSDWCWLTFLCRSDGCKRWSQEQPALCVWLHIFEFLHAHSHVLGPLHMRRLVSDSRLIIGVIFAQWRLQGCPIWTPHSSSLWSTCL